MLILLYSTPPANLRNKQVGDWKFNELGIFVTASNQLSHDSQFAVLVHEMVEAYLCRRDGVTDTVVCAFDEKYEAEREDGNHDQESEPGDDPLSPYREQHMMATHVEKAVCLALGLNWKDHCKMITEGEQK